MSQLAGTRVGVSFRRWIVQNSVLPLAVESETERFFRVCAARLLCGAQVEGVGGSLEHIDPLRSKVGIQDFLEVRFWIRGCY